MPDGHTPNIPNFKRDRVTSVEMDITPPVAQYILDNLNEGNRPFRPSNVKFLTGVINRGEWETTGQGISFDKNGRLIDGQHRLRACVASRKAIRVLVAMGLSVKAFEAIDMGIARTYGDRLRQDQRVATVLRLACEMALKVGKPSVEQMRPFLDAGLSSAVCRLVEFCGSSRAYYSGAPVKLAAVITILNGGNEDFVYRQYSALCRLDFDAMTPSARALVRQVSSGIAVVNNTRDALARAFVVFDAGRSNITKIQVNDGSTDEAVALVWKVMLALLKKGA